MAKLFDEGSAINGDTLSSFIEYTDISRLVEHFCVSTLCQLSSLPCISVVSCNFIKCSLGACSVFLCSVV